MKKRVWLIALILIIIAATIVLSVFGYNFMVSNNIALKSYISTHGVEKMKLTIYYIDPTNEFRLRPMSLKALLVKESTQIFVIEGNELLKNKEAIEQLANTKNVKSKRGTVDAFVYYFFESENGRKLFSYCFHVPGGSAVVNGFTVEDQDIYWDVIRPYIPPFYADQIVDE